MGRRSAFVIGLIVGAIVGWVLAMFTMPHTGQEMREALGERAVELRERAEAMAARAPRGGRGRARRRRGGHRLGALAPHPLTRSLPAGTGRAHVLPTTAADDQPALPVPGDSHGLV